MTNRPVEHVLKVLVTRTGEIRVEGRTITLEGLRRSFSALARTSGSVFYFREDPTAPELHPNAMKVMALIVEHRLPVRIATGPDFTEAADLSDHLPREGD